MIYYNSLEGKKEGRGVSMGLWYQTSRSPNPASVTCYLGALMDGHVTSKSFPVRVLVSLLQQVVSSMNNAGKVPGIQ
jgi:hypothetical protein